MQQCQSTLHWWLWTKRRHNQTCLKEPRTFQMGWKGEQCLKFVQAERQFPFPFCVFALCCHAAVRSIGLYSRPALTFSLECFLWLQSADEGDFWQTTQQFWGLRFIFVTDQHIPLKWVRRFQKNWVNYTFENVLSLYPTPNIILSQECIHSPLTGEKVSKGSDFKVPESHKLWSSLSHLKWAPWWRTECLYLTNDVYERVDVHERVYRDLLPVSFVDSAEEHSEERAKKRGVRRRKRGKRNEGRRKGWESLHFDWRLNCTDVCNTLKK